MELPQNSIGISDLIAYRECPRRMSYGMRRHVGDKAQSDEATPEAGSVATWYGSAIHDAIAATEDGLSDDEAVSRAWKTYGLHLYPEDLAQLGEDLVIYHGRDFPNTRTVAVEEEFKVPLYKDADDEWVYFRFKLDRLYERLDAPGTFIMVDYKSSKWPRSQSEVDEDLQLWAYNFGIHEVFPECERLLQVYDQLKYGQLSTTKTQKQRDQMRAWLVESAKAVLADEDVREDGLLRPKKNDWCAWCPVMESCPIIDELSEWARVEIAALAPVVKEGRKSVVQLDEGRIEDYSDSLTEVAQAMTILKRFSDAVKDMLRRMPAEDRKSHGWETRTRNATTFSESAMRELHERLGPDFYGVASMTKTSLEAAFGDDPDALEAALALGTTVAGATTLHRTD